MDKETDHKQEYITKEMINVYLNKHIYNDNNGIVYMINNKYSINED